VNNEKSSHELKEKKAQYIWTAFILMFFALHAVLWTVAIVFTSVDKSHAIVQDYDQLALNWDQEKAMRQASTALGWQCQLSVGADTDIRNRHDVQIKLTDRTGNPVNGAAITLSAFHRGRAGDPQLLRFRETAPGAYSCDVAINRKGLWHFNGKAIVGNSTFVIEQQRMLEMNR
jgi:nitrogen fixation protein FixH